MRNLLVGMALGLLVAAAFAASAKDPVSSFNLTNPNQFVIAGGRATDGSDVALPLSMTKDGRVLASCQ